MNVRRRMMGLISLFALFIAMGMPGGANSVTAAPKSNSGKAPQACSPNLAPGETRVVESGCTIGGDVRLQRTDGTWYHVYDGTAFTGNITYLQASTNVYAQWGAGLTALHPYEAGRQALQDGCGRPTTGGCDRVRITTWPAGTVEVYDDSNPPPTIALPCADDFIPPGNTCIVPAGKTVGGNVQVQNVSGQMVNLYSGTPGEGNTVFIMFDTIVYAPDGAGITTRSPIEAGLESLLYDGCDNSNGGCTSQVLHRWTGDISTYTKITITDPAPGCQPDLADGQVRVINPGCTIGGRIDVLSSQINWMSRWDSNDRISMTTKVIGTPLIALARGGAGLSTREPVAAARESLTNGCGSTCTKADVLWLSSFGQVIDRQIRLPDDNLIAYQIYLPITRR